VSYQKKVRVYFFPQPVISQRRSREVESKFLNDVSMILMPHMFKSSIKILSITFRKYNLVL
jgi:hypothetical protein